MINQLYLPKGQICLISAEDHVWASQYKWYINRDVSGKEYVCRYAEGKRIYIHREITECPLGLVVDHINANTLDNRRSNLRVCSQRSNMRNRQTGGVCGFKGVTIERRGGKTYYKARITENSNCEDMHLGYFPTAKEAAECYDRAALVLFGAYAWLNFPVERAETDPKEFEIPF